MPIESVRVVLNAAVVSYQALLEILRAPRDSSQSGVEGNGRLAEGRFVICYYDEEQRCAAEASRAVLVHSRGLSASASVEILPVGHFRPAREQHRRSRSRRSEER